MNTQNNKWSDTFRKICARTLDKQSDEETCHSIFPANYRLLVSPRYALKDLAYLKQLIASKNHQAVSLLKPYQDQAHFRLHFYSKEDYYLDEYIPILENLNLRVIDQVQFSLTVDGVLFVIRSFTIKSASIKSIALNHIGSQLLKTIQVLMDGLVENDELNKLLVLTGMDWQEIDVLRAYCNYFLQLSHRVSQKSIHQALICNPQLARQLFNYFAARFEPSPVWENILIREEQALMPLRLKLLEHMVAVTDIKHDRILRTLFNLIDATTRCNFYLRREQKDYFIAFKINSLGVIDMPTPKPQNEIYVHAVDMEGIHLRAGKIARGGIRWSDRPDDFRIEILGLMQTQISKNALIIPTGAKGGFVVKSRKFNNEKEAGKKAYIRLIQGFLDLTDTYHENQIVQLRDIVCHDDPDPYLVVAADKGTAQFSDIANSVSADYQFWLGDAFASGGSHGYDHKALGITARGAWECIKRHFRELGKNIQNETFTVIGIGSMDGDVFGNGMLLSPTISLIAAFSGQHIFIDPNPIDNELSLHERKRLFTLPGSSWNDYDRNIISTGGGVYSRFDKDIPISSEVKRLLGVRYSSLDGESLIRYLLTAAVDLLWLGGIGTYVKASTESHEDVGDRSNDNVRIDALNLKALVVGEGANLGFTQKARIEYSLQGGRINTDAVDNSAGVDTSDHEVNLKILLTVLNKNRIIADYQSLFIDMTREVCGLVLANNYAQSLCLSLEQIRSAENCDVYLQLADFLETVGFFDSTIELFPTTKAIISRFNRIITRPELAVLMAASKMYLSVQIQEQLVQKQHTLTPNSGYEIFLQSYFPAIIVEQYKNFLENHPLAKEIKATIISNKIINQAGCGFLNIDNINGNLHEHISCYLSFDQALNADVIRTAIYALDNKITADNQYKCLLVIESILAEFCRWFLVYNKKNRKDTQIIMYYSQYLIEFETYFKHNDEQEYKAHLSSYLLMGLPEKLGQTMAFISCLSDFPVIATLSMETTENFDRVLKHYREITDYLDLNNVYLRLEKIPLHDKWERKVSIELKDEFKRYTAQILKNVLSSSTTSCKEFFYLTENRKKIAQYWDVYQQVKHVLPVNLLPYVILGKELLRLTKHDGFVERRLDG